jgi:predicted outer membrane protein
MTFAYHHTSCAERVLARYSRILANKESTMTRFVTSLGTVAILLGITPLTMAQQDRLGQQDRPGIGQDRPGQERQLGGQRQATGEAGQLDQKLAAWLACGNRAEVELGQLAAQKATNPQVRQFAEMMVKQHSQVLQQLRQINPEIELASAQGAQQPGQTARQPGQATEQRLGQQAQQSPGQTQRTAGAAEDQLMEIGKQAAERKVELTKTYLQDKQGQQFDMCYIGTQIAAHISMVAELEAMQNAGSPEFQQLVDKASQGAQQHLQQAMQIAQTLEGGEGAAARVTRRPGQPDRTEQPQQPDQDR